MVSVYLVSVYLVSVYQYMWYLCIYTCGICVSIHVQGEVVARARGLDYERQQVHTLTIEATDRASPDNLQLFSTAVVRAIIVWATL